MLLFGLGLPMNKITPFVHNGRGNPRGCPIECEEYSYPRVCAAFCGFPMVCGCF